MLLCMRDERELFDNYRSFSWKRVLPELKKDFKRFGFLPGSFLIFKTSSNKNKNKKKLKRADAYHGLMYTLVNN